MGRIAELKSQGSAYDVYGGKSPCTTRKRPYKVSDNHQGTVNVDDIVVKRISLEVK